MTSVQWKSFSQPLEVMRQSISCQAVELNHAHSVSNVKQKGGDCVISHVNMTANSVCMKKKNQQCQTPP